MESLGRFLHPPQGHFFLFGPRGTGKSTWLRQCFASALWIDLLKSEEERLLSARPERLRAACGALEPGSVVVIDEIQRVPALLTEVHLLIEQFGAGLQFVLTGSSARKLRRSGVDLLAGRAIHRHMHPFLASEMGAQFCLERALQLGMIPLVVASQQPEATLKSYVSLYLQEEVKAEGWVRNLGDFARFLEALSFSQGSVLNLAEVSRECAVQRKTAEGYLEVLEDLLLSFRVPVFTRRARRQLVAHPKFYYFDAGVFRSLRPAGPLDDPRMLRGLALETLVAQHLRAWIELDGDRHALSYWRTRSGSEVDFVVYGPLGFWAIEVKHSAQVHSRDLQSLKAFREDYPEAMPVLLYRGERRELHGEILVCPVDEFLQTLVPGKAPLD